MNNYKVYEANCLNLVTKYRILFTKYKSIKDIDKKIMIGVEKEALNYLSKDILFLFTSSADSDSLFFANVLINLKREIDFSLGCPLDTGFKQGRFILYVNPLIFFKLTFLEQVACLKHEVWHIANIHMKRSKDYTEKKKINDEAISDICDAVINHNIDNLPGDCINFNKYKKSYLGSLGKNFVFDSNETIEYYFDHYESNDGSGNGGNKENNNSSENEDGEGNSNSDMPQGVNENSTSSGRHQKWKETDNSSSLMETVAKNIINSAAEEAVKNRGTIPAAIQELIKKLNEKPIIPWQKIFKDYVGSIPVPFKETIYRRNRRQPNRIDLKGRLPDRELDLIVAIDTSGSISDKDLTYFFNEIFHIIKNRKYQLTVIECDADIQKVYEAKSINDTDYNIKGRGGTAFSPVFEWIKNERRRNALLVYFTDGYGESNLTITPYHYKTLFVIANSYEDDKYLSLGKSKYWGIKSLYNKNRN